MRVSQLVPGRFIEAADLGDAVGDFLDCEIQRVAIETVGDAKERKGVVYFSQFDRPMVLNRTNAKSIAGLLGGETDNWPGHSIRLVRSETTFAGRPCACIRVSEAKKAQRAK
jgi:hypothetical protein